MAYMDDDFDDYFTDDLVLDDATVQALNQAEQKFFTQDVVQPPVNKKSRIDHVRSPAPPVRRVPHDDFESLPDISVGTDGMYGLEALGAATRQPSAREQSPVVIQQPRTRPNVHTQAPVQRPPMAAQAESSRRPPPRRETSNYSQQDKPQDTDLQWQMADMKKKLEEIREQNEKMKLALEDAARSRRMKEGEVAILRSNMEKSAQEHANQVAALKAEKEALGAKQMQMQKDTKDEVERLKTQFLFKQQELEFSLRRPPTIRQNRAIREAPSTPFQVPSAMQSWPKHKAQGNADASETPLRRARPPDAQNISPTKQKSPTRPKRAGPSVLPGFQNSFTTSTPILSPRKLPVKQDKDKGKGKATDEGWPAPSQPLFVPPMPRNETPQPPDVGDLFFQPADNEPTPIPNIPAPSVPLGESQSAKFDESEEDVTLEYEPIPPINWSSELDRILLTHTSPGCQKSTLQTLIELNGFTIHCSKLLQLIASASRPDSYQAALRPVVIVLLQILNDFIQQKGFQQVCHVLDMVSQIALRLPNVTPVLLSVNAAPPNNEATISFVDVASRLIKSTGDAPSNDPIRNDILTQLVNLLEIIAFRSSTNDAALLEPFIRKRDDFSSLFATTLPVTLLESTSRMLALLATHHTLFRAFLGNLLAPLPATNIIPRDPFIDHLCLMLVDTSDDEITPVKENILIFFCQIPLAHPEAHAALVDHSFLIPALVSLTSRFTTSLWEDSSQCGSSPKVMKSIVRSLSQTIYLLSRLMFGRPDIEVNMQTKLRLVPRTYHGIQHAFVVAFARLSYCEPPSWIGPSDRKQLESLVDISKDILESVIDGPEIDNVWEAFQPDTEEGDIADEGEMEAQLIGSRR